MLAQIAYSFAIGVATVSVSLVGGAQQGKPPSREKVEKIEKTVHKKQPAPLVTPQAPRTPDGSPKRNLASKSLPDIPLNDHYPKQSKKRFQVKRKSKSRKSAPRKAMSAENTAKKEQEKKEDVKSTELQKSTEKALRKSKKGSAECTKENVDSAEKKVKTARSAGRSASSDEKKKSAKLEKAREMEDLPMEKTCRDLPPDTTAVTSPGEAVNSPKSPPPSKEHVKKSDPTATSSTPDSILEVSAIEDTLKTEEEHETKESAAVEKKAKVAEDPVDDHTEFENKGASPAIARMKKHRDMTQNENEQDTEFETINVKARPARPKMKSHKDRRSQKDDSPLPPSPEVPKS